MNILYYLRYFPKISQSFVLNEINELENRGHNVAVFARNDPNEDIQHDEIENLDAPVRYAKWPNVSDVPDLLAPEILHPRVLRRVAYRSHPKDHAQRLHLARQCINYMDDIGWSFDLVHSHFARPNKFSATYVAAYYDIPFTLTAHAYDIFRQPNEYLLKTLLNRTDRVMVPSQYNRTYLFKQFDVGLAIDVVPATSDFSKFEPTEREIPNRILTVARLVEKKGIIYAIEALADISEKYPDVSYHIVGTGNREEQLRQRVAKLGIDDRVTFLGNVSDEYLVRELDEAAVFVLPSIVLENGDRDSSPVALKEAMAMATPCISTEVGGIPEIITDTHNGLLTPQKDYNILAHALTTLLDDDQMRQKMGQQARVSVTRKFGIKYAIDELLSSFQMAIDNHDHGVW